MECPAFFGEVKRLKVYDPLAEFLGAANRGIIEYSYVDMVKLAGHSCPTVAGAYLMNLKALAALYCEELPQRGGIRVEFGDAAESGVIGVIAGVTSCITGAAQGRGFKGIAGRFDRRNLLQFGAGADVDLSFTRIDTGASVEVSYRHELIPPSPQLRGLLHKLIGNTASPEEIVQFRLLWQERVRRILIDNFDNAEMIVCRPA